MKRPYVICHMVTSIDGKVTGNFLNTPECETATDIYYEMNREYMKKGNTGFICGRITMEQSFTNGWYPDLSKYEPTESTENFLIEKDRLTGFYAIAFGPKGKLGWRSPFIKDYDPGYDKAQIIEVLTTQADKKYLSYLKDMNIPYIFAGETEIDVSTALETLYNYLNTPTLILEGGSIINGHFLRANCIDELSLVQAPILAANEDKPLFTNTIPSSFTLKEVQPDRNSIKLKYIHTNLNEYPNLITPKKSNSIH